MKRSVRRYQQAVANARRVRILLRHGVWSPSLGCVPKAWRSLSRLVMNEPGWWVHDRVVVPARIRTRRLEHRIEEDTTPIPSCGRTVRSPMSTIGRVPN